MQRPWLSFLGFFAGAALVVLGTLALIAYGNGYTYDFKAGRLVQKGLMIIGTTPTNATVNINGRESGQKTTFRNTFEEGEYNVVLTKDGYRTWQKQIQVTPARASLVQYVILLAQHLQVNSFASYSQISQFVASRDRHRIAVTIPTGNQAGIWSMDGSNQDQTRIYTISLDASNNPTEQVQAQSWSDDASHLLVRRTASDGKVNMLVLAANGSDSPINLTDSFQQPLDSLAFNPNNWRELYWNSSDGLKRLDTSNQTISGVLAPKAAALTFAGDRVLYVTTNDTGGGSLWSLERNGKRTQLVEKLPNSASYQLSYATYIGNPQIVVTAPDSKQAVLYSDAFSHIRAKTISTTATQPTFNGDGRFVLLQDEHHVATYDLERDRLYNFPDINNTVTGLSWYDNYHVQFNRSGQIVMSEYDGNYAVVITRGDTLPPYNSPDTKVIYVTAPTSTGTTQIKSIKIHS
jgi:hypothetical protein